MSKLADVTKLAFLALRKLLTAIYSMSDFSSVFRLLAKTSLGVEIQERSATPLLPADIRADVIADAISTIELHSNTLVTSAAIKEAEHSEVMLELAAFEAREASRKGYKRAPRNIADVHWAGDGVGVRAMHELAAHRGGAQALTASCPWSTWRDWTRAATALHLGKTKLGHLDARLATFSALVTLDISGCEVDTLRNLPRSLQCLQAYGCGVREVEQAEPLPALLHAGLGFNNLQVLPGTAPAWLRCLREAAPGLQSLDVRSCPVLDLGHFLHAAAGFTELKSLCVQGTPGWMATCAMEAAIRVLPGLRQLNGEDLAHVAREYNAVAYAAQQSWTSVSVARAVGAAVAEAAEAADAAGAASSRSKGKAKSKAGSSKKGAKPAQPDPALLDSPAVAAARAHAEETCASQWRAVARQFEHQAALRMHVGAAGPLPSLAPLLDSLDITDADVLPFLVGETARAWLAAGSAATAATPSKGSKAGKAAKKKGAPAAAGEPAMDEYQYVLQLEGRPEHSSADPVFTWRSAPASMCFDPEQIAQCCSAHEVPEGAGCVSWVPVAELPAAPAGKGKDAKASAADSAASTARAAAFTSQTVAVPLTCELVRTIQFDKFELQLLELQTERAPPTGSARLASAAGAEDVLHSTPGTERVLARASIPLAAWLSSSQLSPLPVNALTVASRQVDRDDADAEADSDAEEPAGDLPDAGTRLFPVELSWRTLPAPFMAALRASCKARVAADLQEAAGGAGKGKGGSKKPAAPAAAAGAAGAVQLPEEQAAEAASLARDRAKYVQRNCEPITVHIQAQLLRSVDVALAKQVLGEASIVGSL